MKFEVKYNVRVCWLWSGEKDTSINGETDKKAGECLCLVEKDESARTEKFVSVATAINKKKKWQLIQILNEIFNWKIHVELF